MENKKDKSILDDYFTIEDIAKRWRKNKFTIYRWKDTKKDFPQQYRIFSNILFKIQDIVAYEKKNGIN